MTSREELNRNIDDILERAIVNFALSIPGEVIKNNVEFELHAGMRPRIVRSSDGRKCCPWCSSLAGEYYADEAPEDIYRRHDNCTCTVTYISEKGYQDAHTKKWVEREEVDARRKRISADKEYIARLRQERDVEKERRAATSELNNLLRSDGNNGIINPTITYSEHRSTPRVYEPNAIVDLKNHSGKVSKRSVYDDNGILSFEIHTGDHGNSKHHTLGINGEHVVEYYWNEDGSLLKKVDRQLTINERKRNRGIL
jgi:hypothetical protein